jgi:SAM-dependent methyltransferase
MPTFYSIARKVYHSIIPDRFRLAMRSSNDRSGRLYVATMDKLRRLAAHDDLYDKHYYDTIVDPGASASASVIADSILETFNPADIIDVGCGSGAMLAALVARGIRGYGVDYSQAAVDICRSRGLDVDRFDLQKPGNLGKTAALVLSTEVAEHLPPRLADHYVSVLVDAAPRVIVTAATPGQGGTDHINEQPHEYWIEKFESRGFHLLQNLTHRWRSQWRTTNVQDWYSKNVLVFSSIPGDVDAAINRADTNPTAPN